MTRPVLTLKKAAPVVQEAKRKPPPGAKKAIRYLAGLGLPLFERMDREAVVLPMAVGIREEVLARTDPGGRRRVRKALNAIAQSHRYKKSLNLEGARRRTLDDEDAGPAFASSQS